MKTAGSGTGKPSALEASGSPEDRLFLVKGMVALRWKGMFSNTFRSESPYLGLCSELSQWGPYVSHRVRSPWTGTCRSGHLACSSCLIYPFSL